MLVEWLSSYYERNTNSRFNDVQAIDKKPEDYENPAPHTELPNDCKPHSWHIAPKTGDRIDF